MNGTAADKAAKPIDGLPATTAVATAPLPPKGTCTRSTLVATRNCSPSRCDGVPKPGEAKLYLFGFALISATSSATVRAGTDGCTNIADWKIATCVTASKSLSASYGTFSYSVGLMT